MTAPQTDAARWRIVAGATLALIVGNGPIMQFTFGVFLKPLSEGLHLMRGTVSAALSIGLLATALGAPFMGAAMDRLGTLRVVVPSVILLALALVAEGLFVSGAVSLFAISALAGLAAAGQTPIGYARIIVTWFDRQRGLALGVAMTGVGIGSIAMPIIAAMLITRFGWRLAYVGLAAALLLIALPALLLLVRERATRRPEHNGELGTAARAARRRPVFVKLASAFTLVAFAANGTIAHVVPMLTDQGYSTVRATAALASTGIALICGRLLAGWLLDVLDAVLVTACFFATVLAGVMLLAIGGAAFAPAALFMIGLGLGAEIDLLAYLIGRSFDVAVFGQLYGTVFALFMVGSSVGPLAIGASYDTFGSYRAGLLAAAAALLAAIGLILSLRQRSTASGNPAQVGAHDHSNKLYEE